MTEKDTSAYTRAATILSTLGAPDALMLLDYLQEQRNDTCTYSELASATGLPIEQVASLVTDLAEIDVLYAQPTPSFAAPHEGLAWPGDELPDLARVVIEAIWPR